MVTITLLGCAALYAVAIWLGIVHNRMSKNLIRDSITGLSPIDAISLIIITGLPFDLKVYKFAHSFNIKFLILHPSNIKFLILFLILYTGIALIAFDLIGIILSALVHKIAKHSHLFDKLLINESNKKKILD